MTDENRTGGYPVNNQRSILAISSLYPRPARPLFGIFNYQALRELSSIARLSLISPVSWIDRVRDHLSPGTVRGGAGESPAGSASDPAPHYSTYFTIPFAGRGMNGYFQYRSMLPAARRMHARSAFEFILSYWVYPDGYAAHLLSRSLGIPYAVVALGSDLNIMGHSPQTRAHVRTALGGAARVLSVSEALRNEALAQGAARERCRVVPNGIDPARFARRPRDEIRDRLGIARDERVIVFIGNLEPIKGVDILLDALSRIDENRPSAIIIGGGRHRRAFERRADELKLAGTVTFTGPVPHEDAALFLNAADFLVLPSRFEGCPNVILEALACGTPVIASAVGGIPELVTRPEQGILVPPEAPADLARAIEAGFSRDWPRDDIARTSTRTWSDVARETLAIIEEYLDTRHR